jgi:hypothetical protein
MSIRVLYVCAALLLVTPAIAADDNGPAPAAFKSWQRIWQCNDIRVTETVTQPGIVSYDLGGTIWGGSQFTLNIARGNLYFNGRSCWPLR